MGWTTVLLADGWAYTPLNYSGHRAQLHEALTHTCGSPTEKEHLTAQIPRRNLNTEWQLLPDENWTETREKLPGGNIQPFRP